MRITARLIFPLVTGIALVVLTFAAFQVSSERRDLYEQLEQSAATVADLLDEQIRPLVALKNKPALDHVIARLSQRQYLVGVAIYDSFGNPLAITKELAPRLPHTATIFQAAERGPSHPLTLADRTRLHIHVHRLQNNAQFVGQLMVFHSADHISLLLNDIMRRSFIRLFVHALFISLATLLLVRWNIIRPLAQAAEWIKRLRLGVEERDKPPLPDDLFGPLAGEVTRMADSLTSARAAAEIEARLRQTAESLWTPERLKEHVKAKLNDRKIFVISNREPYVHERKGREVQVVVPPSGLVTALEPILRSCGGTWIAQGSGSADRENTGEGDKLQVPPDEPQYALRRVWLSQEEEAGYYYGFANEGIWPLCHIAHTRPQFKPEDWAYYQSVNQKFADVALEEMAGTDEPFVLIQDYHFALLPRMIKDVRPDARVALFWHIPWPNPESFRICPWERDLLHGMLGADLLGFHIQYHCNNFLDTVDDALESRIDWERFTVNRRGHSTSVKPFPISVAPPLLSPNGASAPTKKELLKSVGSSAEFLGVGVDRIDYTKGIVERFRGIERLLDQVPDFRGRFVFVELAAPSRTLIPRYHDLNVEVEAEAARINARFGTRDWKPIVLLIRTHTHKEINAWYQAADLCLVTSLHDGMNLVAKEFVAAKREASGTLILSCFAGASRELRDALIINPYDIDQTAEALKTALLMKPEEQEARMRRMQEVVQDNNIYKWGASLISDLAQIRLQQRKAVLANA